MAKSKHNRLLDTIDEIISVGSKKGVFHLYTEDENFTGRSLKIKGKNLFHFGTTGYLGLEQHENLKTASVDAVKRFGTQFPLSKTFLSFGFYQELENNLRQMYHSPTIITKNSTLAHIGVIPTIIEDEDHVILDHQVHWSVQNACQLLKPRGVRVDLTRHNNLNMLEDLLKKNYEKYSRIWYMIDGVYSMFGDFAPIHEIMELMNKYPKLHLYVDDVHGMSWAGKNGNGWVMSQLGQLHEKMILIATLSKSFGASGGIVVFPNEKWYRKVKVFGGPLTFSAQLEPAAVAAALASSKIHLSDQIQKFQNELAGKVKYCNELIRQTNLPLVNENSSPVFFIGAGLPSTGYNFVNKIFNEGYYVNLGVFPAVPIKNSGIRLTISRHNHNEDIKGLIEALDYHLPIALKEEERNQNQIRKAFNLPLIDENLLTVSEKSKLKIYCFNTIESINPEVWDQLFGNRGIFDWKGLKFLETAFKNNNSPESNWDFLYYIIKDQKNKIILATFFTTYLMKEDMLASSRISKQIEEKRSKNDPYFLTSQVISMGSTMSEGYHLYLDKKSKYWEEALKVLLEILGDKQDINDNSMIILRDFTDDDKEFKEFLLDQGYLKIDMPEACINRNLKWNCYEEYLSKLSKKSRKHVKNDILKYEDLFNIEIQEHPTSKDLKHYYQLYLNVKANNHAINLFSYPEKIFNEINKNKHWEIVTLSLKNPAEDETDLPIGVFFSYKTSRTYCPTIIGLDYNYLYSHKIYKQTLFQLVKRARDLGADVCYMGLTANMEKKKLGAEIIPKIAFIQAKDNFNLELIESMSVKEQDSME